MKNKYLTKCLCVTMAAALSLAGPAGVLAADGTSLSVTEVAIQSDETAQETAAAKATVPTQVPTAAPTQTPTAAPTQMPAAQPAEAAEASAQVPADPTQTPQPSESAYRLRQSPD